MVENNYYERKIKYLDLMENGERTGGAGFIKTEVKGMDINLTIVVKGLHPTDTYEREVMLQAGDGEFAVGRITLKGGQGEFKYHTVMDHLQLRGVRIALGGVREICCKWKEEKRSSAVKKDAAQPGMVREDAARKSGSQDHETSDSAVRNVEAEKQRNAGKPREIQLIPWDEIKAVEESLERVDKMMSKPAGDGVWKAAERDAAGNTERAAAEQGMPGNVERESAKWGMSENVKREPTESMNGETAAMITEEPAVPGTGAGETFRKKVDEKPSVQEMRTGKSAVRGKRNDRPTTWKRMPGEADAGGRNVNMENKASIRNPECRTGRPTQRASSGNSLEQKKRPVRLMEDKWQQIWAIYPHIHPFQDEREYLSISPADFVLLPHEAYRAANNSFLLHGYYNYDHLILTRIEKRGEVSYYIGVPGNYYEREKQVAIMFGFESFECGTEPAQAGDFGYYMMRTQL
ncbi:MAG: hypothetical protein NC420_11995 [Eubacterium sp.]|nr:hypothetical protein [Eubacterium sp.]